MVPIITLAVGLHLVIHKTLFLGKSKKYMSKFRDITDPKIPPRPWMDVFALPEKSNMAVTESDPDAKVRNDLCDDCATSDSELSMQAWKGDSTVSDVRFRHLFHAWCPN